MLFLVAFNVIVEYVKMMHPQRYRLAIGTEVELLRAFIDDLSLLCSSVKEASEVLDCTI